jgi:hypothetical protein
MSDSYYGRPILKEPVWKPDIPWYFFFGGLAGASSALGLAARVAGRPELSRRAEYVGLAGSAVCPLLLIHDLGRPERFLNMLRVFKVTSPMSVGSWVLAGESTANGVATALDVLRVLPRVRDGAATASGLLGLPLATYTGALLADTAIPVWHEARRELPLVFGASSAASAGGIVAALAPPGEAVPARRLAIGGGLAVLAATEVMEGRLGSLGEPYRVGAAGSYAKLAKTATAAGTLAMAARGRGRRGAAVAGALLAAGSVLLRWSVFEAGRQSARDPKYVVEPQRRRLHATRAGSE